MPKKKSAKKTHKRAATNAGRSAATSPARPAPNTAASAVPDNDEARPVHELTGLRGDNPLGFLAACGLLRACTEIEALGDVKLSWNPNGPHARLHVGNPCTTAELIAHLVKRQADRADRPYLEPDDIKLSPKHYREWLRAAADDRQSLAYYAAFASDAVEMTTSNKSELCPDKKSVKRTALHMMSGKELFLGGKKGLRAIAMSLDPKRPHAKRETTEGVDAECKRAFVEALRGPWQYQDEFNPLGWDPNVSRPRHALSAIAPTDAGTRCVRAAVWLAFEAMPLFPCFAEERAARAVLHTTGFDAPGERSTFTWPLWEAPIRLSVTRSLVASSLESVAGVARRKAPADANAQRRHRREVFERLRRRGVFAAYQASRIEGPGQAYYLFSPAKSWTPQQR